MKAFIFILGFVLLVSCSPVEASREVLADKLTKKEGLIYETDSQNHSAQQASSEQPSDTIKRLESEVAQIQAKIDEEESKPEDKINYVYLAGLLDSILKKLDSISKENASIIKENEATIEKLKEISNLIGK